MIVKLTYNNGNTVKDHYCNKVEVDDNNVICHYIDDAGNNSFLSYKKEDVRSVEVSNLNETLAEAQKRVGLKGASGL